MTRIKPSSSRAKSAEMYYYDTGFKCNDFWRKIGNIDKKELTFQKILEHLPENLQVSPEKFDQLKQNLKYSISHETIKEDDFSSSYEKQFISQVKQEMQNENFETKYKKNPVYTTEDIEDNYRMFCEENNYKYSYMHKLPKTLGEGILEYEKIKPSLMKEIEEMLEYDGNYLTTL
jgi:hypothetical protein